MPSIPAPTPAPIVRRAERRDLLAFNADIIAESFVFITIFLLFGLLVGFLIVLQQLLRLAPKFGCNFFAPARAVKNFQRGAVNDEERSEARGLNPNLKTQAGKM
jgi:hypothetical protein